jgi:iron complex outermembrane receptor protein
MNGGFGGNFRHGWTACAAVVLVATASPVAAQIRSFNVPAQDAASGVATFAKQADIQLLISVRDASGKRTNVVRGNLSVDAALKQLLAGTGLRAQAIAPQTYSVVPSMVGNGPGAEGAISDRDAAPDEETTAAGPIIVTGSRIPVQAANSAHDVRVYDRQVIERSGQTTVGDFLNTLPTVSTAITESGQQQNPVGGSTVRLRGLPIGTTLLLVNGRRIQTSGSQAESDFFDLNNIPVAAIERIEVVADGASAVYGSDAIGGVINIILKKNVDGLEVMAQGGFASGLRDATASLAFGRQWDRFSISAVGSFQSRTALLTDERSITRSSDYSRFGGPNNNFPACNPGNVFSLDGSPLPGASNSAQSSFASFNGTSSAEPVTPSDFNYGSLNNCSILAGSALIPRTTRYGLFSQLSADLSDSLELFGELMYSHVDQKQDAGVQQLFGTPDFQIYTLGAQNPFNPFGETVGLALSLPTVKVGQFQRTNFVRALAGARNKSGPWRWEVAAWQSADSTRQRTPNVGVDSIALQNALDASDPGQAINPFAPDGLGSATLAQSIFSDGLQHFRSTQRSLNGTVRGTVAQLPAGSLQLVVGGELNSFKLKTVADQYPGFTPGARTSFGRRTQAAFAEARIPLLASSDAAGRAGELLTLGLAGRVDHYSDFGTVWTPQANAELKPVRGLTIRGTIGRAFKAPSLPVLHNPVQAFPCLVTDPRDGSVIQASCTFGGNPDLRPIRGNSRTLGFVLSPPRVSGLQISVTNWHVRETDAIQSLSPDFIVSNENVFAGRVLRNSEGQITDVDSTSVNFGSIGVSGIDYLASYRFSTAIGEFTPSIAFTQIYHYQSALTPGSPGENGAGKALNSNNWAPKWKGTLSSQWESGPFSAGLAGRYVGSYRDYDGVRHIGDFWLVDANARVRIDARPWLGRRSVLTLDAGAVNLFNKLPQFSNYQFGFVGYDPAEADIRGRFVYLRLGARL